MSADEKDKKPLCPETYFLPPLKMVLTFLDKEASSGQKQDPNAESQEKTTEKDVEKLIEKLSEKEE